MSDKLEALSQPAAYSLRMRNLHTGEPDKTINANTTFSTLEKAQAYGLGSRYVKQDDGKIVSVRDPSQDPIVEPLYSQEYVTALLAALEEKDQSIAELKTGHSEAAKQISSWRNLAKQNIAEREKDIAALEAAKQRNAELQQRLQQPIKLTQRYETAGYCIDEHYCQEADDGDYLDRDELIASLREQGYQVEGE